MDDAEVARLQAKLDVLVVYKPLGGPRVRLTAARDDDGALALTHFILTTDSRAADDAAPVAMRAQSTYKGGTLADDEVVMCAVDHLTRWAVHECLEHLRGADGELILDPHRYSVTLRLEALTDRRPDADD
jgi:hypothetical protein